MKKIFIILCFIAGITFGCTGKNQGTVTKAISVAVNPQAATTDVNTTAQFTATLQNDTGSKGVTWSVSGAGCTGAACGSVDATGKYTAPPAVPSPATVTVTATSVGDTTKSATATVTVVAAPTVSTTTLAGGQAGTAYSATLQVAGGTSPFAWTVISGALPGGLQLNASSGAITGTPTATGPFPFTAKVTDSATPPQSSQQALSITISAPAPPSITTTSLAAGTVGTAYSATLQATGGLPPLTWSISVGALPAGLNLNASTGAITGTPTTAGTINFTAKVVDSVTPTPQNATKALSIVINAAASNNSKLSGQFAFSCNGWDAGGMMAAAGTFTADGAGGLNSGVADFNRTSGVSQNVAFAGTYNLGNDNRGTMAFTGGSTASYRFALNSAGTEGNIEEFDASGTLCSGRFKKQDASAFSAAAFTGAFAFGVAGNTSGGTRVGAVGRFDASGGNVTGGNLDISSSGSGFANVTSTGNYAVAANGRGSLAMNMTLSGIGAVTLNFRFYVISAKEALAVGVDVRGATFPPMLSGEISDQSGAPFSNASLNGNSVFALTGFDTSHSITNTIVGTIAAGGTGNLTGVLDQNADNAIAANIPFSATYSIAANGRATLAGSTVPPSNPVSLAFYMAGANKAFVMEAAPGVDVVLGTLEPQAAGPFSSASLTGSLIFGTLNPVTAAVPDFTGVLSVTSPGNLSGTLDLSELGSLTPDAAFTATYTVASNGRGTLNVSAAGSPVTSLIFWIIGPNKFVAISGDVNQTDSAIVSVTH